MIPYQLIPYHMLSYHMLPYHIISYIMYCIILYYVLYSILSPTTTNNNNNKSIDMNTTADAVGAVGATAAANSTNCPPSSSLEQDDDEDNDDDDDEDEENGNGNGNDLNSNKKKNRSKSNRILPKHSPESVKDSNKTSTKRDKIDDESLAAAMKTINEIILKEQLDTTNPSAGINGRSKEDPGNSGAAVNTILRYADVWSGIKIFSILIGDYHSAIICDQSVCPGDPFPISLLTARLYLRYKVFSKVITLTHPDNNSDMVWVTGPDKNKVIKCKGSWTSVSTVTIYKSALSKLHKNNVMTSGPYSDVCQQCLKNEINGCRGHRGNPLLRLKGNVTTSEKFKLCVKDINRYIEQHYELRATYAFLPNQLRQIRAYLISQNKVEHLMLWVMLLFSISQGLRFDELVSLTYEQFLSRYFSVEDTHVDSLVFCVNGKRDVGDVNLAIWNDHYCPEFCPVRLILLWVRLNNIKSGFMFPSLEELNNENRISDEPFKTFYSYANILKDVKYLCYDVLAIKYSPKRIIGTHCGRKTKLLFSSWGNFQDRFTKKRALRCASSDGLFAPSLLKDLRHKNIISTMAYLMNSETLRVFKERHGNKNNESMHRVGPYNSIYVGDLDTYAAMFQMSELELGTMSLYDTSSWFLFQKIGINETNFNINAKSRIPYLIKMITEHTVPDCVPSSDDDMGLDELIDKIQPLLSPNDFDRAQGLIETVKRDRNSMEINKHNSLVGDCCDNIEQIKNNTNATGNPVNIKKRKVCTKTVIQWDISLRAEWKSEKNLEKKITILASVVQDLEKQMCLAKEIPNSVFVKSPKDKRWYNKVLRVVNCVNKCYNSNVPFFWSENRTKYNLDKHINCVRCTPLGST